MDVNFCGLVKEEEDDIFGVGLVVVFWGVGGGGGLSVVANGRFKGVSNVLTHSSRGFGVVLGDRVMSGSCYCGNLC